MEYGDLEKREPRFREMAEAVPGALWVHDIAKDRVLYVTPGYERIWRRSREDLYERPRDWLEAIHPDDRERAATAFALILGNRGDMEFDTTYRILRPDGECRWIHDRGTLILDSEGRPRRIVGIAQDVTDRMRAEQASREAETKQRDLERQVLRIQKLESLGVLAGGIAHDFNNLLMGVLGNADLALSELPTDSAARRYLTEIETAAQRAADLCRQMLAYSGKGRFIVEPIDLREAVEEMVHLTELATGKNTVLELDFPEELPSVEGDATQLSQVIMNLLTNASEAIGDRNGVIKVRCNAVPCDRAYLGRILTGESLAEGVYVTLEVSDTGCGMDEGTVERIFDPFFTTKFAGRGLGLSAVQGIVRGHRGAIHVESKPGKGTTFTLLLPAGEREAAPLESPEQQATTPHFTGTALLVDDDATVRAVGRRLLEKAGFQVVTASDGREALALFRDHLDRITVVVLDLTMPRMDGVETYVELVRIKSDVPVILSSGYNEQDAIDRFAGQGPRGFLKKPYGTAQLVSALRAVLDENGTA